MARTRGSNIGGQGHGHGRGRGRGVQNDRVELVELANLSTQSRAFP